MAMKDIFATTDVRLAFSGTIDGASGITSSEGNVVDIAGFNSVLFTVAAKFEGSDSGELSLAIKHSEDNVTFEDALPEHVVGPSAEVTYAAPAQKIGYVGARRYVKLVVTPTTAITTSADVSAHAVLQSPAVSPV